MVLRQAYVFCRQWIFGKKIELCFVGLQNAGKSTFANLIATGDYGEDMIPTVGMNIREFTKDNVKIKCWDLGGQPRFREMCFVVDAADHGNLNISKKELHYQLSQRLPSNIPLLVIGKKIDKGGALSEQALIDQMGLGSLCGREVRCFMISCKNSTGIDNVIDWLLMNV